MSQLPNDWVVVTIKPIYIVKIGDDTKNRSKQVTNTTNTYTEYVG